MKKNTSSDKYYEIILDWFKSQITSGEIREGDTLPSERELANQFGVSRVPVREALRILEYIDIIANTTEGMVVQKVDIQLQNPKMNFATEITMETLGNLFEVRLFLESAAAYYAAQRKTSEDIAQMHQAIQKMSVALESPERDDEAMITASQEFHFNIIRAAKNPVLSNMYKNLYELLEISKQYTMNASQVSESTLMDHEAILYKIENGNADDASKYMKFHLCHAMEKLNLFREV